jgi:hypothetical protein
LFKKEKMNPKQIVYLAEPISGVSEDQIPMIAKCYELPDGRWFLLHSMKENHQSKIPFGLQIDPADLKWNHPQYPNADGLYPNVLNEGMDMAVWSEIDTSEWKDCANAKYSR